VPEWVVKLPKPSKLKRRAMGKVKRPDAVNNARRIGRADAIKKRCVNTIVPLRLVDRRTIFRNGKLIRYDRDMIAGSKRRREKGELENRHSRSDDENSESTDDENES
jgi:hypothetical protein